MALALGREHQPQLIHFFGQLFFARCGLFLCGVERGQIGLLICKLIQHRLQFALQVRSPFVSRRHLAFKRIFVRSQIVNLAVGFSQFAPEPRSDFKRRFRFVTFRGKRFALFYQRGFFLCEIGDLRFAFQQ